LSKFRKLMTVGGLAATLALVTVVGTLAPSGASSHREALQISQDPVADNTDTYAFVSPDKPDTVTLVGNWIPLEEPAGGPNFHNFGDDVKYTLNVDNNGDAVDDIVWEFRFSTKVQNGNTFLYNTGPISSLTDPDFNIRQTYSVAKVENGRRTVIGSGLPVPPANIGPRSTPNYEQLASAAVAGLSDGSKVFAGPRDDPFFVDLGSVFDLAGLRPFNQAHLIPRPTEAGVDGVSGYNTHSIVLQVPIKQLTGDKKALTGSDDPPGAGRPRSCRPAATTRSAWASGSRSRAWACRWSTRSSSRWPRRTASTPPSRPTTPSSASSSSTPRWPG
jgi:Domain of unknown function (DUF4331)